MQDCSSFSFELLLLNASAFGRSEEAKDVGRVFKHPLNRLNYFVLVLSGLD